MLITTDCNKCLKCLDVCKCGAIDIPAGKEYPEIEPYLCIECGECADACPIDAIMREW